MSLPGSVWLTLLHVGVLAGLVCLGTASVQQRTCPQPSPIRYAPTCPLQGQRHHVAREQLLQSLDRNAGKWNRRHPRWQVLEALHGYDQYAKIVAAEIDRFESLYKLVPRRHRKMLESTVQYQSNFQEARDLLQINAGFCQKVFHYALSYYNISRHELAAFIRDTDDGTPRSAIRTAVSQSLKHMLRDWSPEGQPERAATFPYIITALSTHLPPSLHSTPYEILVPGAGLGGLAHEISLLGAHMSVTSNEWSASMNMGLRYLTSLPPSHGPITLHPFLESWSHARTRHELTRPVRIHPPASRAAAASAATTPAPADPPLLIEGDFTTQFVHRRGTYDAIATLFFLDTARNLMAYLETIHALLKDGGVWVNVGPLLYGTAPLVQLSLEEIVAVAEAIGFEFELHAAGADAEGSLGGRVEQREVLYDFHASTLYRHGYVAQCWVAKKRGGSDEVRPAGVWSRWKERLL